MDRRLLLLVVLFGLLVAAGGALGYAAGSIVSLATAGPLGLAIVACGVLALRGVRWAPRAASIGCVTVAGVLVARMIAGGRLLPGAPVAILSLALAAAVFQNGRPEA